MSIAHGGNYIDTLLGMARCTSNAIGEAHRRGLLRVSLHVSAMGDNAQNSAFQKYEFIGDRYLKGYIIEKAMEESLTSSSEGTLSALCQAADTNDRLADTFDELNIVDFLDADGRMAVRATHGKRKADIIEAMVAELSLRVGSVKDQLGVQQTSLAHFEITAGVRLSNAEIAHATRAMLVDYLWRTRDIGKLLIHRKNADLLAAQEARGRVDAQVARDVKAAESQTVYAAPSRSKVRVQPRGIEAMWAPELTAGPSGDASYQFELRSLPAAPDSKNWVGQMLVALLFSVENKKTTGELGQLKGGLKLKDSVKEMKGLFEWVDDGGNKTWVKTGRFARRIYEIALLPSEAERKAAIQAEAEKSELLRGKLTEWSYVFNSVALDEETGEEIYDLHGSFKRGVESAHKFLKMALQHENPWTPPQRAAT